MAQTPARISPKSLSGSDELAKAVNVFKEIVSQLDNTRAPGSGGPRLFFPSGIELITLQFKFGNNVQFTVIIAGKDAPKVGTGQMLPQVEIRPAAG